MSTAGLSGSFLISGDPELTRAWVLAALAEHLGASDLSHPDCLSVQTEDGTQGNIKIEAVRELIHFLSLSPCQANKRVVVLWEAEKLGIVAANALLKVLEEPPKTALVFLVSAYPSRLLPTLLSRCMKIRLNGGIHQALSALTEVDEQVLEALLLCQTSEVCLPDLSDKLSKLLNLRELLYSLVKIACFSVYLHYCKILPRQATVKPAIQEALTQFGATLGTGIWSWMDELNKLLPSVQAGIALNPHLSLEHLFFQLQCLGNPSALRD